MIDKLIAEKAVRINDIVESYLPPADGFNRTVCEAMAYSVEAGGKRLRPMLMEETYRLFGGKSEVIKPFMAAIEMIHTYSLIHDDLPALDNDDYRRGRKTSHVVFGEAMAILAGMRCSIMHMRPHVRHLAWVRIYMLWRLRCVCLRRSRV